MGCLISFTLNCTKKEAKAWNCGKLEETVRASLCIKREEFCVNFMVSYYLSL